MRIVLLGTSPLGVATAEALVKRGHDVVIVETDPARIDALRERLDCGFVHGDGTIPAILRETNPDQTDFLFCLTGNDRDNILASLVGRSLGFGRIITKVEDPEYKHICVELGLTDTIIPDLAIAQTLVGIVSGEEPPELATIARGDLRFFSFVVETTEPLLARELDLPEQTRIVCVYRGDDFELPTNKTKLKHGDEVVLVTHSRHVPELRERWTSKL